MKYIILIFIAIAGIYFANKRNQNNHIFISGKTIEERFLTPEGFERIKTDTNSFAFYLRSLPLKPHGEKVKFYNGRIKEKQSVYIGVVKMDIGTQNLQQCADAVIRLRAEYLFRNKKYDKIHFNFTNGFTAKYSKWQQGFRIEISGNKTFWVKKASPSNSYKSFREYLNIVFMYAGTLSLSKELQHVEYRNMEIGDILIQGGSPGHAVIVVDMAINPSTKEKLFLLAQSYMPAQDIQILINPLDTKISPWYKLNTFNIEILTPEWDFKNSDLKRFINN